MNKNNSGGQTTPPVRNDLKDLKPYEVPGCGAAVELDSNEAPWNLPDDIRRDISAAIESIEFNRYPDAPAGRLKQAIADDLAVRPGNILVGNGSNEVILNLLLAFGGAGRRAMLFQPTYSMHDVLAAIAATDVAVVPLGADFNIDAGDAAQAIQTEGPAIVFVTSPNNPTGNATSIDVIEQICGAGDYLVVVDEAYGEFANESCVPLVKKYKNLAVVKTFSKAFRMAAARVGFVIADEGIIDGVNRVTLPYNLNEMSQQAAEIVYRRRDAVLDAVEEIVAERTRLLSELAGIAGIEPFPSSANFVLFRTAGDADDVCRLLLAAGVQIRNFNGRPGLDNCLRVTIGTPPENNDFLAALRGSL